MEINLREVPSFPAKPILFHMDGGGRELVEAILGDLLSHKSPIVVLEVGSYLGHSTKRWLDLSDNIHVISSDLFQSTSSAFRNYISKGVKWATDQFVGYSDAEFQELLCFLDDPRYGQLSCFAANMAPYLNRVTAYKGPIQENIDEIAKNHSIDLVYLDADKSEDILNLLADKLPQAILTGDDWTWGEHLDYPIQMAVKSFVSRNHLTYTSKRATWIIRKRG